MHRRYFKKQWWNTHEVYHLNHFQYTSSYRSVAWSVFTWLYVQKFGNKSRQLPRVPRTRQALEKEMSKQPRHHGGRKVLQTQPSSALKVVFLQPPALQSRFLLWGTPPPVLFFFLISSLGGRLFLFLETSFSADSGLGSEARQGTQNGWGVTRGPPARAQSKVPRTHNYNHKLCRAAINMPKTTVTHPRGQCSESELCLWVESQSWITLFFLSLLLPLVYMGTEHCTSSFFLKGTLLAVCIHLISLTGYFFLPLNTPICYIKHVQCFLNILQILQLTLGVRGFS